MPSTDHRIILQHPSGAIHVDVPVQEVSEDPARLAAHLAYLQGEGYTILKSDATIADLPSGRAGQSRRFRNQWRWAAGACATDLDLARAQIMAEVRAERDARLAATDGEVLRDDERGQPADPTLAAHRQSLRDLPATVQSEVDAITDPAQLEAYAPTWPTRI